MSKTKHTAVPWKFREHDTGSYSGNIAHDYQGGEGNMTRTIAVILKYAGDEEAKANGEFIVKAVNAHDQLVEALKRASRVLLNVYREDRTGFVSGRYDDPGDEEQEQVEADLFLDEIKEALKLAGEKLPYPDGVACSECGWLSGHHNVGCKSAGEEAK